MWFDLSSQTATQTRASNEARNDGPLRQRARELRHRVLGDVHAVVLPAPVCSICSCRGGDRPPALRSWRLLPSGNRTRDAEFMDPVRVS